MKYGDFLKLEPDKSFIICYEKSEDMPGGWTDAMDYLVGTPQLVAAKNKESVYVVHPNGSSYSFHFKFVEVFQNKKDIEISWKGRKFRTSEAINLNIIELITLSEDLEAITKNIKIENKEIPMSSNILDSIQKHCPRLIGVLLSNDYLRECK